MAWGRRADASDGCQVWKPDVSRVDLGMGSTLTSRALGTLGLLCLALEVGTVWFLRGEEQVIVTRATGVVLVATCILSQRTSRKIDDALLLGHEVGDTKLLRLRDTAVVASLIAIAPVIWLIVYATDALAHRRTYLLVCSLMAGACWLSSHVLDHLAKRGISDGAPNFR